MTIAAIAKSGSSTVWLRKLFVAALIVFLAMLCIAIRIAPVDVIKFAGLKRYKTINQALSPQTDRVVFIGDSITDYWNFLQFFPGKPYVNRGILGQTTSQILLRFRQDVVDLHPDTVVILAGTNDLAEANGIVTLEDIESNYASMSDLARSNGVHVIWSSVLPIHNHALFSSHMLKEHSPEKILLLNSWLRKYCADEHMQYLDYFDNMVDEHGLMKPELSDDGIHPNRNGYALMADLANAAIERTK